MSLPYILCLMLRSMASYKLSQRASCAVPLSDSLVTSRCVQDGDRSRSEGVVFVDSVTVVCSRSSWATSCLGFNEIAVYDGCQMRRRLTAVRFPPCDWRSVG